jgi:ribonuclease I
LATLIVALLIVESASLSADKTDGRKVSVDPALPRTEFDFYLLAMTLHPAFCADGRGAKPECRVPGPRMLSIHGLWPERRQPGRYPRDCPGPPLRLEPATAQALRPLMPGMADGLHEHEWRKHGRCSGLGDDEYFMRTVELAHRIDALLRDHLTSLQGRSTSAAELRTFVNAQITGYGATLTFHCRTLRGAPPEHRREPYLIEIRQCVDAKGPRGVPLHALACQDFGRQDQGCGRRFRIAERTR